MFGKRKSSKAGKQVYTDEQLRHMIAPPVLEPDARSFVGPTPSTNLARSFVKTSPFIPLSENVRPTSPRSVPVIGAIGDSARSRAQIKAYREKARER